ncbi:MAG: protein kinase, partial [Akkermansia sp.]
MEDTSPVINSLPNGTMLGNYEIKGVLGQGGFGISYWAIDHQLEREVVLKEHYPSGLCQRGADGAELIPANPLFTEGYEHSLSSFCKEARIVAALEHPGIVSIHDIFQALGTAYIVMTLVDGCTLDQWMEQHDHDTAQVQRIFGTLLDTLSYLHSREVFHRDIKPSNIMIKEDGSPVLLDFGAALDGLPTQTVTIMASPLFSPPEQYVGHGNVGPWSDLFALGRTFLVLLKGQLDLYPKDFVASLKKATRMDIEDRFQSSAEWQSLLPFKERKGRSILSLWAIISLIVVVGLASTWCLLVMMGKLDLPFRHTFFPDSIAVTSPPHQEASQPIPANIPPSPKVKPSTPTEPVPLVKPEAPLSKIKSYSPKRTVHPRPDAPESLMGTELSVSAEKPMFVFSQLPGSDYFAGMTLMHYQRIPHWKPWDPTGRAFLHGTFTFSAKKWKIDRFKSGDYAYKKLSQDMGLLVIDG